jgi:hypothetical protein
VTIKKFFLAGETLYNRLSHLSDKDLFLAVYEDKRVGKKKISKRSGYCGKTVMRLYNKIKANNLTRSKCSFDVFEAAKSCAVMLNSNTEKPIYTPPAKSKRCWCEDDLIKTQKIVVDKKINLSKLAEKINKSRSWVYQQRSSALSGLQNELACKNYKAIINNA